MSRFFRGGDDSSTESSSEEEELWSGDEEDDDQPTRQQRDDDDDSSDEDSDEESEEGDSDDESSGDEVLGANQFLKGTLSDSEDSDEELRVKVKSGTAKRLEELEASIKQIENGQKNGDWTLISSGSLPARTSSKQGKANAR
jgi:translation initiation factor 3 subunit C